jgi:recombination protein RecA
VKKAEEPQIVSLNKKDGEKFISTGIDDLDGLIGGIPRGRIVELWGEQSVGKTHLVSQIMANISKDHKVLYIDAEFSLNKARVESLGADSKNIEYIADSRLERVCELLIASVGVYDLIILDSLAYLTPTTIDESQVGENSIGLFSRLIKHWIVKFRPRLGVSKTAFIAVNQYRKPIGLYVKPEAPGGTAWLHAVDVRLWLASNSADKIIKEKITLGHWLNIEVKKSKISPPYQKTKIRINY